MSATHPNYDWVDTPEAVRDLGREMAAVPVLGIDTESDSMHSYFEKVCLLQVVLPGNRIFLVDPLKTRDMSALKPSLENPAIRKVLHGADYDIICMKRDFGIAMQGTFCTMTAGLLLGIPKIGLADMVEQNFGVRLKKAFTRSDWSTRPLSQGQLEYLVEDVQFLIPLAEIMEGKVKEAELGEEAAIEFQRLEVRDPVPREFDPWGFLRVRGSRDLPERGRAVLRALVEMRETRARELDRPSFKVLAGDTLLRLAQKPPESVQALRGVRGITPFILKRFGEDIVAAVKRGLADPETVPNRAPAQHEPGSEDRRLSFSAQKRHGRLKEWRTAKSASTGRTALAILPNPAMFEVARNPPADTSALAALPGVGRHRARLYGEDILRIAGPRK